MQSSARFCSTRCRVAAHRARHARAPSSSAVALDELVAGLAPAIAESVLVARVVRAAHDGDWKASAWCLERRFPRRWARAAREVVDDAVDEAYSSV